MSVNNACVLIYSWTWTKNVPWRCILTEIIGITHCGRCHENICCIYFNVFPPELFHKIYCFFDKSTWQKPLLSPSLLLLLLPTPWKKYKGHLTGRAGWPNNHHLCWCPFYFIFSFISSFYVCASLVSSKQDVHFCFWIWDYSIFQRTVGNPIVHEPAWFFLSTHADKRIASSSHLCMYFISYFQKQCDNKKKHTMSMCAFISDIGN